MSLTLPNVWTISTIILCYLDEAVKHDSEHHATHGEHPLREMTAF